MKAMKPKKRYGQHFLNDKNIARKIVDSLDLHPCGNLLEIGPGRGILTQFLLEKEDCSLKAVEIDRESVSFLRERFPMMAESLIQDDFLKLNLPLLFPEGVSIIGNLPYNISSQIFFKIFENRDYVPEVVCMIQKEVARRICTGPGSREYGILSVILQSSYHISYLFGVSPQVFSPVPKVDSAVIRMKRREGTCPGCDARLFIKIVKVAFNQRRKMLRNSLNLLDTALPPEYSELRPEQLSVDQFILLTRYYQSLILKDHEV